jgi:hypothetical protein
MGRRQVVRQSPAACLLWPWCTCTLYVDTIYEYGRRCHMFESSARDEIHLQMKTYLGMYMGDL